MDPGRIRFTPAEILGAIDDHMAWYVEHHTPGRPRTRSAKSQFDAAAEKLLSLNPGLSAREALEEGLRFGVVVGTRVGLEHRDADSTD